MSELHLPKHHLIALEPQPFFPYTDLSDDNSDMLREILAHGNAARTGLQAQSEHLAEAQRYIHYIADFALKLSGIATRYDEDELAAFSHGFATFETINIVVKPTGMYDMAAARRAVHQLFVDSTDGTELELQEMIAAAREGRDIQEISRDRALADIELAERHAAWAERQPNTYDVVVNVGARRGETIRALHARTMGAAIAYTLETGALDAAS